MVILTLYDLVRVNKIIINVGGFVKNVEFPQFKSQTDLRQNTIKNLEALNICFFRVQDTWSFSHPRLRILNSNPWISVSHMYSRILNYRRGIYQRTCLTSIGSRLCVNVFHFLRLWMSIAQMRHTTTKHLNDSRFLLVAQQR